MAKRPDSVPATVVGVEPNLPPIHAVVVGDERDSRGKRLAILAFGLVLVMLVAIAAKAVGSYVDDAAAARLAATTQRQELLDQGRAQRSTVDRLTKIVDSLRLVVDAQSRALAKAGLPDPATGLTPALLTGPTTAPRETPRTGPSVTTRPATPTTPGAAPRATPTAVPGPRGPRGPSGAPAPSPTPTVPANGPLGLVCIQTPLGRVCL